MVTRSVAATGADRGRGGIPEQASYSVLAAALILAGGLLQPALAQDRASAAIVQEMPAATQLNAQHWPLPATEVRAELAQQLLELAVANVHPAFGDLWLSLSSNRSADQQARLYADVFATLHHFRAQWRALSWDDRERLQLKKVSLVPTPADYGAWREVVTGSQPLAHVKALHADSPDYAALRQQLIQLLDLARQGNWPKLPDLKLHPDDPSSDLAPLAEVMQRWGLLSAPFNGDLYSGDLVDAVKRFQSMHGLTADGVIGRRTLAWMRVTPARKAVILARSMLRQDTGSRLATGRYVLVNLPAYQLRMVQDHQSVLTSRVIVGQLKRQTPILDSQIASVILNPAWHVPTTILQQDIVPKLAKDPTLLAKEGFDIIDAEGERVDPASITLDEAINTGFHYRLRQQPGTNNALGLYKFYLPNNDAIYLHSTAHPALFNAEQRAISSGCVRVEQAPKLAELLLKGSAWGPDQVTKVIQSKNTKWLQLKDPIPVFTVYWRTWLDTSGQLQFRDDIYGFDQGKDEGNNPVMASVLHHQKV